MLPERPASLRGLHSPPLPAASSASLRAAKCLLLGGFCLLAQSCAVVENEKALDALSVLTGKSRTEIFACAGTPDWDALKDGKEFAAYSAAARHTASGVVLGIQNCTVRFVFDAGRVSEVKYDVEDPGIMAPYESCAQIISTCLR